MVTFNFTLNNNHNTDFVNIITSQKLSVLKLDQEIEVKREYSEILVLNK